MQCVILAGGLGTRMAPWTAELPKTLIPVGDAPFAHYQLRWLARHGVQEVVYSIGHKGEMIRDYVGDGTRWGLAVQYVADGPVLVGTAGALRRVHDAALLRDWFLVLYGDSFLPFDFRRLEAAFLSQDRPALMAVYRNEGRFDTGNVRYADGVVQLYRKARPGVQNPEMPYIDYGISAWRRELVAARIPAGERMDLAGVYEQLSTEGKLAGWEASERFYEIGSPAGLKDLATWLARHPEPTWGSP